MMWSLGASKHTHIVSFDIRVRRGCGRRYAGAAAPCAASPCPSSCCRRQQARAPSAARRQWFPRPEEGRPAPQAPPCCYSHREGQGNGNGRGGSALRYLAKGPVPSISCAPVACERPRLSKSGWFAGWGNALSRSFKIISRALAFSSKRVFTHANPSTRASPQTAAPAVQQPQPPGAFPRPSPDLPFHTHTRTPPDLHATQCLLDGAHVRISNNHVVAPIVLRSSASRRPTCSGEHSLPGAQMAHT
jgi:hypothetical protein